MLHSRFFYTLTKSLFNLHQSPSTCIIWKIYKMYNDGHDIPICVYIQQKRESCWKITKAWKKYEKSYLLSQCLMKKDLIVVHILYNRCVLYFKFYICRLKWNKRVSPLFPVLCMCSTCIRFFFSSLFESNNSPCFFLLQQYKTMHSAQIHETNLQLKFLCKWRRKPVGKQKPCNEHEQFTKLSHYVYNIHVRKFVENSRHKLCETDLIWRQAESRCVFFWHS